MFTYLAILAIFISCLGLIGLAIFTNELRVKEIGIRKTLGASTNQIVVLREFSASDPFRQHDCLAGQLFRGAKLAQ